MTFPDDEALRDLVRLACRAPSVHNTQPWHWVVTGAALRLYVDPGRQLKYADPTGRELTLSCGAALHQLTVTARGQGWVAAVDRFPDPTHPTHLATISFEPHIPDRMDHRMRAAIHERRTDRRQVSSWPVPRPRLEGLASIASRFGVLATVAPDGISGLVPRLLRHAMEMQERDAAARAEVLEWIHPFFQGEGIPMANLLTSASLARGDVTRFPPGSLSDGYADAAEPSPAWMVLSTASDDALSWLRTGEALDAIWLACTVAGLGLVPFSQPIEVASTRTTLEQELLEDSTCAQILLRIGWPPITNEPVPSTARRPLDEVLDFP